MEKLLKGKGKTNSKKVRNKSQITSAEFVEEDETIVMEVDADEDAQFEDRESGIISFKGDHGHQTQNNNASQIVEDQEMPSEDEEESDGEIFSDNEYIEVNTV